MILFNISQAVVSDMQADIVERAREQAQVCSVFGNPSRVLILWALGERELSVSDLASAIECSLQSTSQHLHLMKDRGILTSRRDGQTIYYRVNYSERLADCGLMQLARSVSLAAE
jgi:ArsR family transcriptional regulator, virulence genes transcriptional regulator